MRFDVERAAAHARALDFPRFAGTEGERGAADYVAAEMEKSGLTVERREAVVSRFHAVVAPRLAAVATWLAPTIIALTPFCKDAPFYQYLSLLAVLWIVLLIFFRRRLWIPPYFSLTKAPVVRSGVHAENPPAALVVFVTPLDAPLPGWSPQRRFLTFIFFLILFVKLTTAAHGTSSRRFEQRIQVAGSLAAAACLAIGRREVPQRGWGRRAVLVAAVLFPLLTIDFLSARRPELSPYLGLALLALVWALLLCSAWGWPPNAGGVGDHDNRTGLAVMLELARAWPRGGNAGLEAHFVAMGRRAMLGRGMGAPDILGRAEWPFTPILFVCLDAPGFGPGVVILGSPPILKTTAEAAKNLWIPFESIPLLSGAFPVNTALERKGACMTLRGGAAAGWDPAPLRRRSTPARIDPAGMVAAAQLAREVALRFGKGVERADQAETAARSFQKPG